MTTSNTIKVVPVSSHPERGVNPVASSDGNTPAGTHAPVHSLSDINGKIGGGLLVPSVLPAGFGLAQSGLLRGNAPIIEYHNPTTGTSILLREHSTQGKVHPKEGYYETISIGDYTGYLVRGAWTQFRHKAGEALSDPEWREEAALSVMFQRGDRWIDLAVMPANGTVDAAGLVGVALSLGVFAG